MNKKQILIYFCFFCIGCHLDRIPLTECLGTKPDASFTLSATSCDLPCPGIKITKPIVTGAFYTWLLDDKEYSKLPTPPDLTLTTPKSYELKLIISNDKGCKDSTVQFITVGNTTRFKLPLEVSTANCTPLYATQRSDGSFHCLYNQSGIKSVIVSPLKVLGTPVTFNTNATSNQVISFNGGFFIARENSNKAETELARSTQGTSTARGINFGGTNPSVGQGMVVNGSGDVAITGSATVSSAFTIGFGVRSSDNLTDKTPPLSLSSAQTGLSNFSGLSIVQRPNNNYFITAYQLNPLGGTVARLVQVNATGGFISPTKLLEPLRFALKIIRLEGDFYALVGRENSSPDRFHLMGIDANGDVKWTTPLTDWTGVRDLVYNASDKTIVVCGTKSNTLYGAKFTYTTTSASIKWQFPYNESVGTSSGISVVNTIDGGFLFYGSYINNALTKPYLVKVDNNGN